MRKITFLVVTLTLAVFLFPFTASASYNVDAIKSGVTAEKLFQSKGWTDAGNGMWQLDSGVTGMKVVEKFG